MKAMRKLTLLLLLTTAAFGAGAEGFPDLRDSEDPELKAAIEHVLRQNHLVSSAFTSKRGGLLVADVTDLRNPKVASFNPELMTYAASLPKIGIIQGVFVEAQAGRLEIDEETRQRSVSR